MLRRTFPDVANVNSGPASIDEDGAYDAEGVQDSEYTEDAEPEVNQAPEGDAEDEEASPLIHGLSLTSTHLHGMQEVQTTIVANVHTSTGIASKRMVVAGGVTVAKLVAMLANVERW